MHKLRDTIDTVVLGFANWFAWLGSSELVLKNVLLLLSIGYASHRWLSHIFRMDKKRDDEWPPDSGD